MVELTKQQAPVLGPLFSYTEETVIRSFLQGYMGRGWTDNPDAPTCGQIVLGDFCFLAGDAGAPSAAELVRNRPDTHGGAVYLIVPENEQWSRLIEANYAGRCKRVSRYGTKKTGTLFDREQLRAYAGNLPEGYSLRQIDEALYRECMAVPDYADLCAQFRDAGDFLRRGLGFCVMLGDQLLGGASSYSVYENGLEIEIVIDQRHRRKGLAIACASKLILACLDRGIYPSWDAANKGSLALAEKLGYEFSGEYPTYLVDCAK